MINGMAYAIALSPTISHQSLAPRIDREIDRALDGASSSILIVPVLVLSPAACEADVRTAPVVHPAFRVDCDSAMVTEINIYGAPDRIIEVFSFATVRHPQKEPPWSTTT
jgi:hypothetical protein